MSSGSLSGSEECCSLPPACLCENWLTAFCDHVTVTIDSCEVEVEYTKARRRRVRTQDLSPQNGVHSEDYIFEVSWIEQDTDQDFVIGATITDSDGRVWTVYRIETSSTFCVSQLWARSVSACFALLDDITIQQQDCVSVDCGEHGEWTDIDTVRGTIRADGGRSVKQNESFDIVANWIGRLENWPLDILPAANHRLVSDKGNFRIRGFTDGGPFVPYVVQLERESEDCPAEL